MLEVAVSELPSIYSSIISWLQPPYLYILINAIIIIIFASSKLQHSSKRSPLEAQTVAARVPPPLSTELDYNSYIRTTNICDTAADKVHGNELKVQSSSGWMSLQRENSLEFSLLHDNAMESSKPPVSSRLSRRKSVKINFQGKSSLRVSKKPRCSQDTLEKTCRLVMEGRPMPLTQRHLKKSQTRPRSETQNKDCGIPTMKKAETFSERSSIRTRPPLNRSSMRREPSLSQEELNRRAEAFIKKFNEEMRLQRQQSLDQNQQMVSHSAGGGS